MKPGPPRPETDTLAELESRRRAIEARMAELERMPEQLQMELLERESTIPPPEYLKELQMRREFEDKAARGEIRNERRTQARSLLLMVLLLIAIAMTGSWLISLLRA